MTTSICMTSLLFQTPPASPPRSPAARSTLPDAPALPSTQCSRRSPSAITISAPRRRVHEVAAPCPAPLPRGCCTASPPGPRGSTRALRRRQLGALHLDHRAGERRGRVAIVDALEPRHQARRRADALPPPGAHALAVRQPQRPLPGIRAILRGGSVYESTWIQPLTPKGAPSGRVRPKPLAAPLAAHAAAPVQAQAVACLR